MTVSARAEGPELPEDAVAFVRFCRERRAVAWPEIYDEMCAVARRRLFRGWGFEELADHGVEFGLFQLATLSAATRAIIAEESDAVARCPASDAALSHADLPEETSASAA